MSYETYKIIHLTGLFLLFSGLAGIMSARLIMAEIPARPRRLFFMAHGLGLLLALLGGFGLAARLGYMSNFPNWLWGKIVIWLIMGGAIALAKRKGQIGGPVLTLFIGIGVLAAWLAITKPF